MDQPSTQSHHDKRVWFFVIALVILCVPTVFHMIRPGIYSMQDASPFRLYEYTLCVRDWQLPCRWSPDLAYGLGQPLFNYYGQLPYFVGGLLTFAQLQVIDATKALFGLTLVGSTLSMFVLAKQLWKNSWSALVSAIAYTYAPYRSVDVYVRGALSEAAAFVVFPLIVYFFNRVLEKKQLSDAIWLGIVAAALILTHNLSVLLLAWFIIPYGLYRIVTDKKWQIWPFLLWSVGIALLLSAFYLLPVIVENQFISLSRTVAGFYHFSNHFATINQLLISPFWGYGASTWGPVDGLSFNVGYVQWLVPIACLLGLVVLKQGKAQKLFFVFFVLGWLSIFLTHNKSTIIWQLLTPIQYLQFPWRFLSIAVFSFSLCLGVVPLLFDNKWLKYLCVLVVIAGLIGINTQFFREDIWLSTTDQAYFSGTSLMNQTAMSRTDYQPISAEQTPDMYISPYDVLVPVGVSARLVNRNSWESIYSITTPSSQLIIFPIVYFPGWQAKVDNSRMAIQPEPQFGRIGVIIPAGTHDVTLQFMNTQIRTIGNSISLVTLFGVIIFLSRGLVRRR